MRNLKVIIAYKGSAYHGFQRQENAVAIQNIIENKLSVITNNSVEIFGCSRTDTGVHANEYCFSFNTEHTIPCENIVRALNTHLPKDIAVKSCEEAPENFHARYSCTAKEYEYLILNSKIRSPFYYDLALFYPHKLDFDKINEAASYFVGTHDFKSFCNVGSDKIKTIRTIEHSYFVKENDFVKYVVKADGFLYNMIRIIVGTIINVNEGRFSVDEIPTIIEKKDRAFAGKTAVATGLYLNKVFYEN